MAGENQKNTGPNPSDQTQNLRSGLKNILDDQGDYNNLLKNAISDLKKLDDAYSKIEARINSLNKDSINIKNVSQELYKLKQKEYLESKKLSSLEKDMQKASEDDYKKAKEIVDISKELTKNIKDKTKREKEMLDLISEEGNQQAIALYAAEKQFEIAQRQTRLGAAALENEKQVSKQMGISGFLAEKLAKKLGVGEEAYSAMTLKARELVDAQGKAGGTASKFKVLQAGLKAGAGAIAQSLTDPTALAGGAVAAYKLVEGGLTKVGGAAADAGNYLAGLVPEAKSLTRDLAAPISGLVKNIPLIGGLLGGLIDGFAALVDMALGVDQYITNSARSLGLSKEEAKKLNEIFIDISYNSGNVFVNSRKLMESQIEISKELGVNNMLTGEILETNIMLKDVAGLEADTRANIAASATITGRESKEIVKSITGQVLALKKATGITFDYKTILGEANKLSGYLGLAFAKYPEKLTKSLLTTKALGLELSKLDSMANGFLDFESSISKEFEAQLLTGKNINLNKARELFLNNELAEAALEITSQLGSADEFFKLNRIQAEAIADAFGMSRDELGNMLKQQELLTTLGAKATDSAQEQLRIALERYTTEEDLIEAIGEEAYQNLVNASTQEKMAALIEKIKQSIVDFVTKSGILDKITGFIDWLSEPKNVQSVIQTVRDTFADIVEVILQITNGLLSAIDFITLGYGVEEGFQRRMEQLAITAPANIRGVGGGGYAATVVSDTAAKNEVEKEATAKPAQSTAIKAPSNERNVYIINQTDPITGKSVQRVATEQPDMDGVTGAFKVPTQ